MPQLTPDQMHRASVYLPVEQIILAAAYLTPDMLQYQIDNIDDYRGPEIIASGVIVGILAAGAVVFRLVCRRHMEVPLSYDDYLIIAGLVTRNWTIKACGIKI